MLGDQWHGSADDILDAVAAAGYEGVEFSNVMIGAYRHDPQRFAAALARRGLRCAAYAYSSTGFTDAQRFEADLAGARLAVQFSADLKVLLGLGGPATPDRQAYQARLAQAVAFYRAVAELGARKGVTVCVHPHSHYGSLLESAEEYDALLAATADSGLMFNPDAGHIVRGGQELMDCLRRHRKRIAHMHVKDVDATGQWQPLGQGVIDWRQFFGLLQETHYSGWIVAEEESSGARKDPAAAVARNRQYLASLGL
jgi:sugar phosphate isomerase/epimerase